MTNEHHQHIVRYYDEIATDAYDTWGAYTNAIHFGLWEPAVSIWNTEPEEVAQLHVESHHRMIDHLTRFINAQPGDVVVDAGCGTGSMLPGISLRGAHVIGVNISPGQLEKARQHIARIGRGQATLMRADYTHLPVGEHSVNTCLMLESLCYAPDISQVIREAARVLKPGGELVVADLMLTSSRDALHGRQKRSVEEIDRGFVLHNYPYDELKNALKAEGFLVVEEENITAGTFPSIQLAAASAERHSGEIMSRERQWHRQAAINLRDMTTDGVFSYVLVKAQRL